jgi:uroporphyrinogen-III decarboxylase
MEDPVLSKEGMNAGRFGSFIVEINNHQNKSVHTFKHSYTSIVIPKDFSPELRKVSSCIIDYIGLEVEQEK